jgi:hypothetical protein
MDSTSASLMTCGREYKLQAAAVSLRNNAEGLKTTFRHVVAARLTRYLYPCAGRGHTTAVIALNQ